MEEKILNIIELLNVFVGIKKQAVNVDSGMNSNNLEKGYLIQMVVRNIKHHLENKQNQAVNVERKTEMKNTAVKPEIKQSLRTDITTELNKVYLTQDVLKELLEDKLIKDCGKIATLFYSTATAAVKIAQNRFVTMKNLPVWYDREQSVLFSNEMYKFYGSSSFVDGFYNKINKKIGGFIFRIPKHTEFIKSFSINITNPVVNKDVYSIVLDGSTCSLFLTENNTWVNRKNEWDTSPWGPRNIIIILISSLKNSNSESTPLESVKLWLKNNLIPDNLDEETEVNYKMFAEHYDLLEAYIKDNKNNLYFDVGNFYQDILNGKFAYEFCGYNFNYKKLYDDVLNGKRESSDFTFFKKNLLECDYKRANISPYTEKQLTDLNLGHWELAETADADAIEINVPETEHFIARPPQMDVIKNGVCGIDFGTKSTVVACFKNEARLLRVGEGDFTKAPELEDYENPTVIELRDLEGFIKNYKARAGRPFTEWEQLTVSHQAAEAIMDDKDEKTNYYSVFSELKQWAIDKKRRLMLCDKKGKTIEIKPYQELKDGNFDPIEIYAYYLGLYINNMNNGIYMHYVLSFPVNYELAVRDKLLKSFERGLKKALPSALLKDEAVMKNFKIYAGASEPAAYAISALQEFKLQPKDTGESVCYGVFDFGGGTTDFDFGIEEIPEDGRSKYKITQFGSGGDVYLGGENILLLLAYEVYKDNLKAMREKQIPFVLPPKGELFSGAETLIYSKGEGSQQAYLNSRRLAEELRPVWERKGDYKAKFTRESYSKKFLTNKGELVEVPLKVNVTKLENIIKAQIESGVQNFFTAFRKAFKDKNIKLPVHIFLAGNSSKSPVVKELFEKYIKQEEAGIAETILLNDGKSKSTDKCFVLHLPLGAAYKIEAQEVKQTSIKDVWNKQGNRFNSGEFAEKTGDEKPVNLDMDFDKIHTGKTGVVFGLLRSRKGARDVKIVNKNNDANNEVQFRYLLGVSDHNENFKPVIGWGVGYNKWEKFTWADEEDFDLFYTSEPKALEGNLPAAKVNRVFCSIDSDEVSEDANIYIRKTAPDKIQYTVAEEEEISSFNEKAWPHKIYSQTLEE